MPSTDTNWEDRLGRQLRLRDLHLLSTVVRCTSIARGARELGMSQPAVSEAIANLEHALRVPLLDRKPTGVAPTIYAEALLKHSAAIFDELRQGLRDIEFLSDPRTGQITVGCPESIASTLLPPIIETFSTQNPGVTLRIENIDSPALRATELRDRRHDLIFAHLHPIDIPVDDLNIEPLFDDPFVIAASKHSLWAGRESVELADLVDARWILLPARTWIYQWITKEYGRRGLPMPTADVITVNTHITFHFLNTGRYLTVRPRSWVEQNGLATLPINVRNETMPVALVTLKGRTLSPVVENFLIFARRFCRTLDARDAGLARATR